MVAVASVRKEVRGEVTSMWVTRYRLGSAVRQITQLTAKGSNRLRHTACKERMD